MLYNYPLHIFNGLDFADAISARRTPLIFVNAPKLWRLRRGDDEARQEGES